MNYINKIFLTGEKRIGKSSFIKQLIKRSNINAEGFFTQRINLKNKNEVAYRLMNYSSSKDYCLEITCDKLSSHDNIFLIRAGKNIIYKNLNVFNDFAARILALAVEQVPDIILLDEIGFIEENANLYRKALKGVLKSDIKTLGVLQKKDNSLIKEVINHKDVSVYELNGTNKDEVEKIIIKYLNNG